MPELPEVYTVARDLRKNIQGKTLREIESLRAGTVRWQQTSAEVLPQKIRSVSRRGKFILVHTESKYIILIHLRMTGRLYLNQGTPQPHTRAIFHFSDGEMLFFDDPRTFGTISIHQADSRFESLEKLGPEPLSKMFDKKILHDRLSNRKISIKEALLNQSVLAGIGNIYASEILFRAGIDPRKISGELGGSELERLYDSIRSVLRSAIRFNGTTISDFRRMDGSQGQFHRFLRVYGKEHCDCGASLTRIKQNGRSTWFCPVCQT